MRVRASPNGPSRQPCGPRWIRVVSAAEKQLDLEQPTRSRATSNHRCPRTPRGQVPGDRRRAAEALGWSGRSEDIDIVPETCEANLGRLAKTLDELGAKLIGDPAYPDGLPVPGGFDARLLATKDVWNLMTTHGQLDITTDPSGTRGYAELINRALKRPIPGTTTMVHVASARDIIASKTAAGGPKDIAMLPALRQELGPWLGVGARETNPRAEAAQAGRGHRCLFGRWGRESPSACCNHTFVDHRRRPISARASYRPHWSYVT